ncbi:DUF2497 domain-containing protein [Pseudochrobactrum algeriensis]|uniref:PopZ family protein n=1 Tax=Pseudochrobactrum algeriensis TaxID=2834768 RepID=UPI001BD0A63B|nr:DUF2497 domain-containing protein [Pseudochrobactrum algeriensis]MBX8811270.1 DUF2497 domain-containing protein [Ochrobactrum sp. MR34]QVQ38116.1 DUF2497 domain-containing protein [Pseudochrobactrum algeriensis]QVQ41341.1 DUF2497 domain-containing protein [Pseudochrobactrum algeriensis]QVQ45264.1 DUF2497 domain-containing protein [Pseudochrobactrum algeriensis]
MAQTSSATREPSMEEILASIRRIIEDSDVTKQATADLTSAPAAKAQPENRAETIKTSEPPAEEKRGEVAQFPRAVSSETVQTNNHVVSSETTAAETQPAPSFTLDAILRGSIQEQASPAQKPELTRAEMHERNVAHVRIATVNPPVPPVVISAAEQPKSDAIKMSEALLMQVAEKQVVSMTQPAAKEEVAPVSEKAFETAPQTVSAPAQDKSLISEAAEKQVAASFGSLSQALIEEQKRLLNEKMEAMLRPMLQEWLDTNLPPLVERLVREEIERVVRRG